MADMDEWGRDPLVRAMRKVFKGMETAQKTFLERLDIIPYDSRIRGWRERALDMFENAWEVSARKGINIDEERAAVVYVHCLSRAMDLDGIDVSEELLPDVKEMEKFLKEVF